MTLDKSVRLSIQTVKTSSVRYLENVLIYDYVAFRLFDSWIVTVTPINAQTVSVVVVDCVGFNDIVSGGTLSFRLWCGPMHTARQKP